jgi:hypothetical protein
MKARSIAVENTLIDSARVLLFGFSVKKKVRAEIKPLKGKVEDNSYESQQRDKSSA